MKFYLGTHRPHWLKLSNYSLFVSHRRLRDTKKLPVAKAPWALDSGGFTELSLHGRWTISEIEYVDACRRYAEGCGKLEFISPQDWMCEPWIIEKTGKSVKKHQRLTVENFLMLRDLAPELPWVPVLQGWELSDYLRCVEMYEKEGVVLSAQKTVGIGSVCRRQHSSEIQAIVEAVGGIGIRLHGFGVKKAGLIRYSNILDSADSMAWSFTARHDFNRLPGCDHGDKCQNCIRFAMWWREDIVEAIAIDERNALACPECSGLIVQNGRFQNERGLRCLSCHHVWLRQVVIEHVRPERRDKSIPR